MQLSDNGRKFLEFVEGRENKVYPDSNGVPTIGVGHALTVSERKSGKLAIKKNDPRATVYIDYRNGITDEQIDRLLTSDLVKTESIINIAVKVPLKQYQYDALVSFVHNVGVDAFNNSTLLKLLNRGEYQSVPTQMRRWVYDDGVVVQGLVNRREHDIDMWNGEWADGQSSEG
jgi:lysozyme